MEYCTTTLPGRFLASLTLLFALGWGGARGQQTITYTDGQDQTTPIVITPATSPTTLTVASGSATQSGVISDSGGAGAVKVVGAGTLTFTANNTYTGNTTVAAGNLIINGGSIYTANPSAQSKLIVGADDTSATLIIQNGGQAETGTTASDVEIGYNFGSNGAVIVTGPGSSLGNANSTLSIGVTGSASLTVSNGGAVRAAYSSQFAQDPALVIANLSGTSSSLTVTGAGSSFTTGTDIIDGDFGAGAIHVANSGTVTTTGKISVGSRSSITVDGSGSNLNASTVYLSSGSLTVSNGGNVQSPGGTIELSESSFDQAGPSYVNIGAAEGSAAVAPGTITAEVIDGYNSGAVLNFNHTSSSYTFLSRLTGDLAVHQNAGTTILTATSTYTGPTVINGGTLVMNGSVTNSPTTVNNGGTLAGTGSAGGTVTVRNGGIIAPGNGGPGTLTVGSLILNGGSILNFELNTPGVVGGGINDLIAVNSNLTLDGVLNLTLANTTVGNYTLFTYGGTLTDDGLVLGDISPGFALSLDTGTAGQVILHVGVDNNLYWNGTTTTGDGTVHGGNGTWDSTTTNWTFHAGAGQSAWNAISAVFAGTAGTVNVSGTQIVQQLQFATDGYTITGGALDIGTTGATVLVGTGLTATIASKITDSGTLTKTGDGTLILSGTNDFRAGVTINSGTVSINSDANLGNALGLLTFTAGTLATTADITSIRSIEIDGSATFDVAGGTTFTSTGVVSGNGNFRKEGAGTFAFNSTPSYTGDTTIDAGTVDTRNRNLTTTSLSGNGGTLAMGTGLLTLNQDWDSTYAGTITGTGGLTKNGLGDLKLTGTSTYTGPTAIVQGSVTLGAANAISADSQIQLAGGTFNLNGFSPAKFSKSLLVLGAGSQIDFGLEHEGSVTLQFADSSGELWSSDLMLINFSVGLDKLGFGTNSSGLTQAQLADIDVDGYAATGLDANGYVVFQSTATPEPSVSMLLGVSFTTMLVVLWHRRRDRSLN